MKNAVIFKIPGNIEMEYKDNADKNFEIMFNNMREAVKNRSVEILHNGPFDLERDRPKFSTTKRLTTYAVIEFGGEIYDATTDAFWEWLSNYVNFANWPELLEKTYTYQMVSMQYFAAEYEDWQVMKLK